MSNLEDHEAEQSEITAMCEAGICDHPECQPQDEPATSMRCPACGNTTSFIIMTQRWAMHTENGDDPDHPDLPDHDSDWDEYASCICPSCKKAGIVQEFQI